MADFDKDLSLVVNGYTFPLAKVGGYKVIKRKLNAYAERTPTTMRIDQLGDVWEINYTIPPQADESVYKKMADALKPFVVQVEFYNPFTQSRMTTTFYHVDLELTREWRGIHQEMQIDFIGTEVMK